MSIIKLLDNNTINKIAAGEVVERPSSVVKELAENSIDAGASAVTVEIRDGGTTLIKISDNGSGIPKEQVKTAFLRHATSKIEKIDDLDNVLSLGFRGEALASIASVAQVEMITKTADEETGVCFEIDGGHVVGEKETAASTGTVISVKNIFYNVPARRKFLKKPATESGYISETVNKLALAHPEVSFKFINNGNTMLHTSGNNDLKTAAFYVFGKDMVKTMTEIDFSQSGMRLWGLIGKPELSRGTRGYENLFLNGRSIKNETVSRAVEDAMKTRLMIGKFPVFVLNLEIPPDMADVNVHPAKLEVRFRDEDVIYDFVYSAVTDKFSDMVLIREADWDSRPSAEVKALQEKAAAEEEKTAFKAPEAEQQSIFIPPKKTEKTYYTPQGGAEKSFEELKALYQKTASSDSAIPNTSAIKQEERAYIKKETAPQQMLKAEENKKEETKEIQPFFSNYKIVGQLFNTYWIIEQGDSMFMIDQHAAHERILYEKFVSEFKNTGVAGQRLIMPVPLNLTEKEKETISENMELFEKCGFEIEAFGNFSYALKAVPYIFKEPEKLDFFTEILDSVGQYSKEDITERKFLSIATMACKAAVKANDRLTFQEAHALVEKLLKLENPFSCPHGRPTIIELTKYELEKKFKRIQ